MIYSVNGKAKLVESKEKQIFNYTTYIYILLHTCTYLYTHPNTGIYLLYVQTYRYIQVSYIATI